MQKHNFPRDFLWGAASSSYQIEGSVPGDGRGRSIWDDFCDQPGRILDGSNGLVACRHTELYARDVDLLVELGVKAYRFSVAWPRVLPEGRGRVNEKGIDFYKRLIDRLHAKGIEPWITLYHWDLPSALEETGGWRNRDTAYAFADYAALMAECLKNHCRHWITHNEPWCVAVLGHRTGEHAPGLKDPIACLRAAHHVLLSHGLAVPRLRQITPAAKVGITLNLNPSYPANPDLPADREATRIMDGDFNRWYLDPVFYGRYPDDMLRDHRAAGLLRHEHELVQPGDLAQIAQPIDFLGVNYYSRAVLGDRGPAEEAAKLNPDRYTQMGWEIYPQGLSDLMQRLAREYPVAEYYITENGAAFPDTLTKEGRVHDVSREKYYIRHLAQVAQLCEQGIPLKGYFAWSIMDNFEWAWGYERRFGLAYVDYETQERIPKDSFFRLKQIIHSNHVSCEPETRA